MKMKKIIQIKLKIVVKQIIKKIKTISEDINNDDIKMDEFLDE